MKKIIAITALVVATSASAFWNNNNGSNGNGYNNWGPFDSGSNWGVKTYWRM